MDKDTTVYRVCTKCKQLKPATTEYFHKAPRGKYGLCASCIECRKAHHKSYAEDNAEQIREKNRRYREENRETVRANALKWYRKEVQTNPEYRERLRMMGQKAYQANPEKYRQKTRDYNARNREKVNAAGRKYYYLNLEECRRKSKEYSREHAEERREYEKREEVRERRRERSKQLRKDNPFKYRAKYHKHRARRRQAPGKFTADDVSAQYESQKGRCYWCEKKLNGVYEVDHIFPIAKGGSNWPENLCCACPDCNRSKGAKLPHEWKGRLF